MLSNDRFVASFGAVPAGDLSEIVKVGVHAVRNGFGIVPCHPDTAEPMCTLTAAAAKKEPDHDCYHVITDDKQARTILTRLTRNEQTVNLAIDLEASKMIVRPDNDNPTIKIGNRGFAFLEGEPSVTDHWLVPPSVVDGTPLMLVGQTNPVEEEEPVTAPDDLAQRVEVLETETERSLSALEAEVDQLRTSFAAMKSALVVALKELQELKNR